MTFWSEFTRGLWREVPPFRLVLGLCPTLAVTTSAETGMGMGVAVIFVLAMSNVIVSSIRKLVPKTVRIVCFVGLSAGLAVIVELTMQAFAYPLYQKLGIFVPLIAINCIVLARADAFAAKNPVHLALADGLGMGIGYTGALIFLGSVREILGKGEIFGHNVVWSSYEPFAIMVEAPGAFLALGLTLATMNFANIVRARRAGLAAPVNPSCGCASCGACSMGKVSG